MQAVRATRDGAAAVRALAELGDAAQLVVGERGAFARPLMPLIIAAVRARATVGEISDTLATQWGRYRPQR